MKQITKRFLSLLVTFVALFSSLLIYLLLIRPANERAQGVKAEVISQEQFLEEQSTAIEQVEKLISEYQGEGELQDVISKALPPNPDLSGALAQMSGLVRNNGLNFKGLTFSVSGNENVSQAPAPEGAQAPMPLIKPIGTVRIELTFSGSYEDAKRLLQNLETNLRIFDVVAFNLSPPGKSDVGGRTVQQSEYTFTMTVVTYYQAS